jgi:hypothetical protein
VTRLRRLSIDYFLALLHLGQLLSNCSMLYLSFGNTNCLAEFSASSRVLNTSQSNFEVDRRM